MHADHLKNLKYGPTEKTAIKKDPEIFFDSPVSHTTIVRVVVFCCVFRKIWFITQQESSVSNK